MPIDSQHPLYKAYIGKWTKCRDVAAGEEQVKSKGSTYLPRLSSMASDADLKYLAYKERAMFYAATPRTIEGLVGMVMRKPPQIKVPAKMEHYLDDITGTGIDLEGFIKIAIAELLTTGRYSIHADRDVGVGDRSYLIGTIAEGVTNWMFDGDGNLSYIVFMEHVMEPDASDKYEIVQITQYREFYISEEDGKFHARLWRQNDKKDWIAQELDSPTFRGELLDSIPQMFLNVMAPSADILNPPLLGMVNVNLSHYRTYADLEHGRHFTALPTPYIAGDKDDFKDGVKIGSEEALILGEGGSAGYMEFTGSGLKFLESAADEKAQLMAVLGARLLQNQKLGIEAAETARINKSGDTSIMASIAVSVESATMKALEDIAKWDNITGEISVEINKDMLDADIDPALLTALVGAWQNKAMSKETLIYNFMKGELLQDGRTIEDEIQAIADEVPALTGTPIQLNDQ